MACEHRAEKREPSDRAVACTAGEVAASTSPDSEAIVRDALHHIMAGNPAHFVPFVSALFEYLVADAPPLHDRMATAQHIGLRAGRVLSMALAEAHEAREEAVEEQRHTLSNIMLLVGCGYALSVGWMAVPASAFVAAKAIDTRELHHNMVLMNSNRTWIALFIGWGSVCDMETSWLQLLTMFRAAALWWVAWCAALHL